MKWQIQSWLLNFSADRPVFLLKILFHLLIDLRLALFPNPALAFTQIVVFLRWQQLMLLFLVLLEKLIRRFCHKSFPIFFLIVGLTFLFVSFELRWLDDSQRQRPFLLDFIKGVCAQFQVLIVLQFGPLPGLNTNYLRSSLTFLTVKGREREVVILLFSGF